MHSSTGAWDDSSGRIWLNRLAGTITSGRRNVNEQRDPVVGRSGYRLEGRPHETPRFRQQGDRLSLQAEGVKVVVYRSDVNHSIRHCGGGKHSAAGGVAP
jgi:hypothetical protein